MFTGIVEEIGEVTTYTPNDPLSKNGTTLTITLLPSSSSSSSSGLLSDCHLGDSIAVNGVCLTVTSFTLTPSASFTVGIAPETLRLTNLGSLRSGSRVNLERAVRADTRMGGHFVQGHVDTVAEIIKITPDGEALTFRFRPKNKEVLRYVVYKGFIALDGTSLTVTAVNDEEEWWEVMLIAYTQERVVVAGKKVGETVNVEVDMTAKYVEKSLRGYLEGLLGSASAEEQGQGEEKKKGRGLLEKVVEGIVKQGFS
ncbi:riboflavin synthase alpha chain [Neurospora tetrasperma FGSC 2508]|uniref:Riboflavin synthase n=1 Tax=Neurospora tetrasperma (strain FGSC 2508 / ATCC MYA-4615 / P0657) TaxID=510951 RepID=F8MYS9_NEUT8|nr:riboflavin synthase alpha chain [Neurospora tetrasperma FGSC 2508]EGO51476.1 riboflavin synthase alpha chain [Neurospora tetrasperma FGSC 2508]EGZ78542.1 riboflavin synthase alpha chain [Neurospora tetrasperma FGSC 2509]